MSWTCPPLPSLTVALAVTTPFGLTEGGVLAAAPAKVTEPDRLDAASFTTALPIRHQLRPPPWVGQPPPSLQNWSADTQSPFVEGAVVLTVSLELASIPVHGGRLMISPSAQRRHRWFARAHSSSVVEV